jgi:hypothetical protein
MHLNRHMSRFFAVTLGTTRRYETPLGSVSLHRVAPSFFFGLEQRGLGPKIAVPEKALVDTLYLRPARSRRFRALPELEIPRGFSMVRARKMARRIASPGRRALVLRLLWEVAGGERDCPPRLGSLDGVSPAEVS